MVEGAFKVHEDMYHIKAKDTYHRVKRSGDPDMYATSDPMVIYRDSVVTKSIQEESRYNECGVSMPIFKQKDLLKRSEGCPLTRKIIYMGVAADCTYVQHYKTKEAARLQIINDFNTASALFEETFNVALGLIKIMLMEQTCPVQLDPATAWNRACEPNYSLYDRLSDFSLWRNQTGKDGAGLWHLMTNCPVGLEVGLAWLGQLCNTGLVKQEDDKGKVRYVSGASVSSITRDEWKIVAHEIGHSFGAMHDCNAQNCPCTSGKCSCCPLSDSQCSADGAFIMNPTSNSSVERFSPCSIKTVCSSFPSIAICLSDPKVHLQNLFQLNTCGNDIKEEGEECDTGGKQSACCDPKTCKLINNAVCEDMNDGCCHECQLQPSTHMCRPALSPCDQAEYCTGNSSACPPDKQENDGSVCGLNGLTCASGQCTSRDQQCFARGYRMNITSSCLVRKEECKMLCEFPGDQEKCTLFSSNFLDGTLCGENGKCSNGICEKEVTEVKEVKATPSLSPVILATLITTGGVLLFSSGGFWFWLRKKKAEKERTEISTSSSMTLVNGRIVK
ncbi:unnamed protein product [Rhizopus stolonifer]